MARRRAQAAALRLASPAREVLRSSLVARRFSLHLHEQVGCISLIKAGAITLMGKQLSEITRHWPTTVAHRRDQQEGRRREPWTVHGGEGGQDPLAQAWGPQMQVHDRGLPTAHL